MIALAATAHHAQQAARLVDDALGAGVAEASGVAQAPGRPGQALLVALVAGSVVGACLLIDTDGGGRRMEALGHRLPGPVRLVDLLVVAPDQRGLGVGTRLLSAAMQHTTTGTSGPVIAWAWRSGHQESYGLFARAGFEDRGTLRGAFRQESVEHGYRCAVCGSPPCRCAATLMVHRGHR